MIDFNKINVVIDYVSGTTANNAKNASDVDKDKLFNLFKELINMDNVGLTINDRSTDGYRGEIIVGENMFYKFNGAERNNMSTSMLMLKGRGCREFEKRDGNFYKLFETLINYPDFNFTRLDLAIDLFTTEFGIDMFNLREMLENFNYICNAHGVEVQFKLDKPTKTFSKQALIIGSINSETQLEIYNKKLERENYEVDIYYDTWIRFELRFKKEKATSVVTEILKLQEPLNIIALGLLKDYIKFVEPDLNKEIRPWETWEPWKEFLNGIKEIEVKNEPNEETSIEVKKKWLRRSTGLANSQLLLSYDDLTTFQLEQNVNMYLKLKDEKMTEQKLQSINDDRVERKLQPLTMQDVEEWRQTLFNSFFDSNGKPKPEMKKICFDNKGELRKELEEIYLTNDKVY